ncbi:hypothetical protein HDU79_010460 [Rhizoclosmatium sp. JEL0117]|nr:hypothetical protein HDU79_010460 [Rhizoclosmatium sp. JEL0117]
MIAYNSTASVVGVLGANSSDGRLFDYKLLADDLSSYLIGILIGLAVNFLVFPDSAEQHLRDNLSLVFIKTRDLSLSMFELLNGSHYDTGDSFTIEFQKRNKLVSEIQICFATIDAEIIQAAAEVTYSYFSIDEYARITRAANSVVAVLFSAHTVLNAPETVALITSAEYQQNISDEMKQSWKDFGDVSKRIFDDLGVNLRKAVDRDENHVNEAVSTLKALGAQAIRMFANGHQPIYFSRMFDDTDDGSLRVISMDAKAAWEQLLQINFLILSTKEFIKELAILHEQTFAFAGPKKYRKFRFNWYIPPATLIQILRIRFRGLQSKIRRATIGETVHAIVFGITRNILSPNSVYAFKTALAVFSLQMIMFSHPDLYKEWYMGGALSTIIVAVSPSLGQTYIGLPLTIVGTASGATLAYLSLILFGKHSYGQILFGFVAAVPFTYLQLFNKRTASLGLLGLLAFGNYISITYANMNNPAFDAPAVYLYKVITVASAALSFSLVFTLILYPSFARHILRHRMSIIFLHLNIFYRKIVSSSIQPLQKVATIQRIKDPELKDLRNQIFSEIVALDSLMVYAIAEPRIEGRFQEETYREIINCMFMLLDRLECVRLSVGDEPFDADVRRVLKSSPLMESRAELQQVIRLLLYIFSSSMLTKLKILPTLPNAQRVRERVIEDFVNLLLWHGHPGSCPYPQLDPFDGVIPAHRSGMLEALNTEKWMRLLGHSASVREVSRGLDKFVPLMKALFGEYPDIIKGYDDENIDIVAGPNDTPQPCDANDSEILTISKSSIVDVNRSRHSK